jgi:hypothetical protein
MLVFVLVASGCALGPAAKALNASRPHEPMPTLWQVAMPDVQILSDGPLGPELDPGWSSRAAMNLQRACVNRLQRMADTTRASAMGNNTPGWEAWLARYQVVSANALFALQSPDAAWEPARKRFDYIIDGVPVSVSSSAQGLLMVSGVGFVEPGGHTAMRRSTLTAGFVELSSGKLLRLGQVTYDASIDLRDLAGATEAVERLLGQILEGKL